MKPSNTGINWEREARERAHMDRTAEDVYDIGSVVGYSRIESVCEWAAQIAIAEYRKELAAKVDEAAFANTRKVFKNGELSNEERRVVLLDDVLSLLNKNDDGPKPL